MTESKKSFLVILLMLFLSSLIIVPPLLRVLKPKSSETNKNVVLQNAILTCSKSAIDNYKIVITTRYKNNEVEKIDLKFENNSKYNNEYNQGTSISSESRIKLNYFASLVGSYYSVVDNTCYISLSQETKTSYPKDMTLKNMFSKYNTAKKYYENDGYTCK